MEAKVIKNDVVVRIPIDTLIMAFDYKEDNYNAYKVANQNEFAHGVADYLVNYVENSESGLTVLQEAFDKIFDEMVCNGEEYIGHLNEDEN